MFLWVCMHETCKFITGKPKVGVQNTLHQHTHVYTITHMLIELQHSVQASQVRKELLRVEKTLSDMLEPLFTHIYTPKDIREICFSLKVKLFHSVLVDCGHQVPDNSPSALGVGH